MTRRQGEGGDKVTKERLSEPLQKSEEFLDGKAAAVRLGASAMGSMALLLCPHPNDDELRWRWLKGYAAGQRAY